MHRSGGRIFLQFKTCAQSVQCRNYNSRFSVYFYARKHLDAHKMFNVASQMYRRLQRCKCSYMHSFRLLIALELEIHFLLDTYDTYKVIVKITTIYNNVHNSMYINSKLLQQKGTYNSNQTFINYHNTRQRRI